MYFTLQSVETKLFAALFFAGDADPLFHLVEVLGESAAAGGGQAVFGAGYASFKKLHAGNVLGFFELAGVHAEVAVGGFEHALKVVEAERIVGGEGADDAEADALVNQAIEFGEFGSDRSVLADFVMRARTSLLANLFLDVLTMGSRAWRACRGMEEL